MWLINSPWFFPRQPFSVLRFSPRSCAWISLFFVRIRSRGRSNRLIKTDLGKRFSPLPFHSWFREWRSFNSFGIPHTPLYPVLSNLTGFDFCANLCETLVAFPSNYPHFSCTGISNCSVGRHLLSMCPAAALSQINFLLGLLLFFFSLPPKVSLLPKLTQREKKSLSPFLFFGKCYGSSVERDWTGAGR